MAGLGAVVLLGIPTYMLWPRITHRYDRWSATRRVHRAAEFFAKGDFEHAALDARSALELNPLDPEATRMMARAIEAKGGATAAMQWRKRLDLMSPGDAENLLALAKDALGTGDAATAEQALGSLKPADRNGAAYHGLMAGLALGKRDTAGALAHWTEAAKLDPKEDSYRLNLAMLQAGTGSPAEREGALKVLGELSTKEGQRMAAQRALLMDAINHGEAAKAKELAKTVASDPKAVFPDKLARLSVLRTLKDPEATAYLLELRDAVVSKPAELFRLLMWMSEHDLPLMVSEWVPELPAELVEKPPVAIAVADARVRNLDWEKVENTLFSATWGEHDHIRQAYRTRALDHLGADEQAQAAGAWNAALVAAGKRGTAFEALAKMATAWGWERRAEEALWKLTATEQCPRWVREKLWSIALKRLDTQQLQALAMLMVKADPRSIVPRNDAIFLSLLLRSTGAILPAQAAALHAELPDDPNVATTYGLSLYQHDRAPEAVTLMEKFTPEQLRVPGVARYFGIFLSATDRRAEAEAFLKLGEQGVILPEETAMIARAREMASAPPGAAPPVPKKK